MDAKACSFYKISSKGQTMVGSNYDAYFLHPKIWFEAPQKTGEFGAVFSGGNYLPQYGLLPQMGMNEAGLTFSRLVAPETAPLANEAKKNLMMDNPVSFLTHVMHSCQTLEEVKAIYTNTDYSFLSREICIYVDRKGNYLIIEDHRIYMGNDSNYVLSNFCPSQTKPNEVNQERYIKGVAFLKTHSGFGLDFCTALSDTMHVCRPKMGDGTLLSAIRDLGSDSIHFYFYHDYAHRLSFHLPTEISKGNHEFVVADMFPANAEFIKLNEYKTPQNTAWIEVMLLIFAGVLFLSSILYGTTFLWELWKRKSLNYKIAFALLAGCVAGYCLILILNENIFYFDAPYKHYAGGLINISSYLPYTLLLAILPLWYFLIHSFRQNKLKSTWRVLALVNMGIYQLLLIGFYYWGLF